LTLWERWSRFLEAGGRLVVEIGAALATVALAGSGFSSACRPEAGHNSLRVPPA